MEDRREIWMRSAERSFSQVASFLGQSDGILCAVVL
jgi:hypothetical protein